MIKKHKTDVEAMYYCLIYNKNKIIMSEKKEDIEDYIKETSFYQCTVGYSEYIFINNELYTDFSIDSFLFWCGIPNRNAYMNSIFLFTKMHYYDSNLNIWSSMFRDYIKILEYNWSIKHLELTTNKEKVHWVWLAKTEDNTYFDLTPFKDMMDSWSDYDCHLWTNYKSVKLHKSNITLKNINEINDDLLPFCNDITVNVGIRSDIIRQLILYNEGGIYCDINDTKCIKPFNFNYNFICGVEPSLTINNAIFYSKKHHPILERMIKYFRNEKNTFRWTKNESTDVDFLVINQTGPIVFTRIIYGYLLENNIDCLVMPSKCLYSNFHIKDKDTCLLPISYCEHYDNKSFIE